MNCPLPHSPGRGALKAAVLTTALLVLTAGAFVPMTATAASDSGSSDSAIIVDLEADGSATVTVTYAFDLTTQEQREAFEMLRNDDEARAEVRERFEARMTSVAADAAAETEREMTISATTVDVIATDSTGLVHLSVEWSNLAAVENGQLILSEPFASGFETDRPVTVYVPEGYAIEHANPTPNDGDRTHATWNAGTVFDGFELVAVEAGAAGSADEDQPGFGIFVTLIALGMALFVFRQ